MLPRTRAFGPSHSTNDRHMLWMGRIREDNGNVAVDDEDEDEPRKCGKDKGSGHRMATSPMAVSSSLTYLVLSICIVI
jgi:hypothetical protein